MRVTSGCPYSWRLRSVSSGYTRVLPGRWRPGVGPWKSTPWPQRAWQEPATIPPWTWVHNWHRNNANIILVAIESVAGPADHSVLRPMRHRPRSARLLASLRDAPGHGRLGQVSRPGLPPGGQLPEGVLLPLPVPGPAVSIGCAHKPRLLSVRLRWIRSNHSDGSHRQDAVVAVRLRQAEGFRRWRRQDVVSGLWRGWRDCECVRKVGHFS